jgi:hypothetical protein
MPHAAGLQWPSAALACSIIRSRLNPKHIQTAAISFKPLAPFAANFQAVDDPRLRSDPKGVDNAIRRDL